MKEYILKPCKNPNCDKNAYSSLIPYCSQKCKDVVKPKILDLKVKSLYKPIAEKKCKGTTEKTIGFGCGILNKTRIFGLGKECGCYKNWLLNSDNGAEYLKRVTISISNKLSSQTKTENNKQRSKDIIALMTKDEYRAKVLQPNINKIVRLIDFGQKCIATNNFGKMAGGHRISVGANRSTSLNLHNIHIQSFASNSWKGGDNIKYDIGIKNIYGQDYLEFLNSLHQTPKLEITKDDMIEVNKIALKICLELSKNQVVKTPKERIELRNKYNIEIGIYSNAFSIFAS
jgi:Bacteriophage Lambda NinG protein